MNPVPDPVGFEALDECHRQIALHLALLSALRVQFEAHGLNPDIQREAGVIEHFFSSTSREHHAQEEQSVFPALLASGESALVAAVRSLQQDHGWIEENWLELSPQLRAIAAGDGGIDAVEFGHYVDVFLELCRGHIALEETLIYPESKARWARAVAERPRIPRRWRVA